MMEPVLQEIREKLAEYIFGENEDTIQSVVAAELTRQDLSLCVLEVGTEGLIFDSLAVYLSPELLSGQLLDVDITHDTFKTLMQEYQDRKQANFVLGVMLTPYDHHLELFVALLHDQKSRNTSAFMVDLREMQPGGLSMLVLIKFAPC